jgi:hypothetical protein
MNKNKLASNVGQRLRLHPEPRGWHGSILDGDWMLANVETRIELRHTDSGGTLTLGHDQIHEYMTDASGGTDGMLTLHVNVRQQRDGTFVADPIVPRVANTGSRVRLTEADFKELAHLIDQMNESLKRLVREKASDESLAAASAIQVRAEDWIATHVGPVAAKSFNAAPPDPFVPAGFPREHGGIHQRMRGRLTHLTHLAQRLE